MDDAARGGIIAVSNNWSNMIIDVLQDLMRYVPFRARLKVMALVCKHWRRAAHASIEEIPDDRMAGADCAAHALFPNLSVFKIHCTNSSFGAGNALPLPKTVMQMWPAKKCARVRTLRLETRALAHLVFTNVGVLDDLTNLEAVEAAVDGTKQDMCLSAVLTRNQSSITRLSLNRAITSISSLLFPRLTSLALRSTDTADIQCISLHISCLVSLSIPELPSSILFFTAPRLTSLSIARLDPHREGVVAWLAQQRSLVSLRVDTLAFVATAPQQKHFVQQLSSCLVHLGLSEISTHSSMASPKYLSALIPLCTKLACLGVNRQTETYWRTCAALGPQLKSLVFQEGQYKGILQDRCTAITTLKLRVSVSLLRDWKMPHLRRVELYTTSAQDLVTLLTLVPTVEEIEAASIDEGPESDFEALFAALRDAEKRGIRSLSIRYGSSLVNKWRTQIRALDWIWVGLIRVPRSEY